MFLPVWCSSIVSFIIELSEFLSYRDVFLAMAKKKDTDALRKEEGDPLLEKEKME